MQHINLPGILTTKSFSSERPLTRINSMMRQVYGWTGILGHLR